MPLLFSFKTTELSQNEDLTFVKITFGIFDISKATADKIYQIKVHTGN